ncbi:MAG: hypothetical protein JWR00_94 [Rubritepida sp.]|nr:hypothetical protein [Rubritepida sp.]
MWDFEKVGSQLTTRHWSKEAAVLKILKTMMVVTMESRAGNLSEADLSSLMGTRINRLMLRQNGKEKTTADEIDERYPQVDFDDALLSAPLLSSILIRGEMDGPGIVATLDASKDYAKPGEQRLWLQAMQVFGADDATCDRVATEIEAAFTKREFSVRGELIQVFGIRLWFAKIGLILKDRHEIINECRAYVDDLARERKLHTKIDTMSLSDLETMYGNYVIPESGSQEWLDLQLYYDAAAKALEKENSPIIAQNLVDLLQKDPDEFFFELAVNNVKGGRYWNLPILASFPPKEYANIVFMASPDIQSRSIETLHSRHDSQHPSLGPERPWIGEVKSELKRLMVSAKPMTRYRLEALIARNLDPLLPKEEPATAANIEPEERN